MSHSSNGGQGGKGRWLSLSHRWWLTYNSGLSEWSWLGVGRPGGCGGHAIDAGGGSSRG